MTRTGGKRSHAEHDFQRVCFAFLTRALPDGAYVASLDSAQKGSATQRIMDARRGIRPGQCDMLVKVKGFEAIKIELKAHGGVVSDHQQTDMEVWRRNGGGAFVAYSLDELEAGIRAYGIPLRATAGGRWEAAQAAMAARAAKPKTPRKPRSLARIGTARDARWQAKRYGVGKLPL